MSDSIDSIIKDAQTRMKKSLDAFLVELEKIRTGRANVSLLDHVQVDYYGSKTPLSQVANVTVVDARTLGVKPWEKNMVPVVEKAIRESDLGLNPATSSDLIRVPIPPLTEERRRELGKVVRGEGEQGKIAVRNIRRDSNTHLKTLLKDKAITEDEDKRAEAEVQKLTDRYIADIDKLVEQKEKDLLEI